MSDKSHKTKCETETIKLETKLENSIIKSQFDEKGNLVKIEKFNKDKSQKLSEATFAEDGRTIKEQIQYEYSNDNTKEPFKKTIYNNIENKITILNKTDNTKTVIDNNNNITTIENNINNTITTETYYPNENIKTRTIKNKTDNKLISIEEFYNDGKTVNKLETYENGKRIKSELFDDQSRKIQEDTYYSFDDSKVHKSTSYDADTGREIEDKYFDSFGRLDKTIKYTYKGNTKQLDTYNDNNKIKKTEIINTKDNSSEELIYDNNGRVKQVTKFYPNNEKDVEIFFDDNGKIDKLKTYYENKCNREYSFQNINDFNRDKFLLLSTTERENLLDRLIERNTKCCTEYSKNGQKVFETFYREDEKTIEKMIRYDENEKKIFEIFYKKDGKTREKMIAYNKNEQKTSETFYKEDGKDIEKIEYDENEKKDFAMTFLKRCKKALKKFMNENKMVLTEQQELDVLIKAIKKLPTQEQSKTTTPPLN